MSNPPRISVIMPSYQQGRYLDAALRSVLDQQYPNLELIVMDGGSTDESVAIIKRHASHITYWQSQPDGGQVAAINSAMTRATGDVMGWLNSDDILLPGSLARIGRAFQDAKVQAVCGWNISFADEPFRILDKRVYPQPTAKVLLHRPLLPQETVYWRRGVTEKIGPLNDQFKVRFDTDYWVRMVQAGVVPRLVPHLQSGFRQQPQQKTVVLAEHTDAELARIFERVHGESVDLQQLKKKTPLGWRLRYRLMRRLVKLGWPSFNSRRLTAGGLHQ